MNAEVAAEVSAACDNPVPSAEELTSSRGVLAFIEFVAFQVCFHSERHLQVRAEVCRQRIFYTNVRPWMYKYCFSKEGAIYAQSLLL